MKRDVYQEVTNQLLELMEEHGSDWVKPWADTGAHRNVVSGKAYRGINTFLTGLSALGHSYASQEWGTYKQWAGKGAQVRKGEKATSITFWKKLERENDKGEKDVFMMCRYYAIFNADQVDGYTAPVLPPVDPNERDRTAEQFIMNTGTKIKHEGGAAFYSTHHDMICLPALDHFDNSEAYYSTAFHELTHWTGHKKRLDRDLNKRFGSKDYAAEELVAETGAALLSVSLGLSPKPREDHAKYLNNWLSALNNDKRFVFTAFSKAQQAVDFMDALQVAESKAA